MTKVCKWYAILTLFLTGLCHFDLYEKTFFIKHQPGLKPKLYLVNVGYQMSTRTATWLMFDIKHQPELYLVDV